MPSSIVTFEDGFEGEDDGGGSGSGGRGEGSSGATSENEDKSRKKVSADSATLSAMSAMSSGQTESVPPLTAEELREVYRETIEKRRGSLRKRVVRIDSQGVEIEIRISPDKHVRFSDRVFVFFNDERNPYDDDLHLVPTQKWIEKMRVEKHRLRQTRILLEMKRASKEQDLERTKSTKGWSLRPSLSIMMNKIRLAFTQNPRSDDYTIDGALPPRRISVPKDLPDSAPRISHIMVAMASNVNAIESFITKGMCVTLGTIHREISFKTLENPERFGENVNALSEKLWLYVFMVSQVLREDSPEKKSYVDKFRYTTRRRIENILYEAEMIKGNLQRYFGTFILFKWRILSAFVNITRNSLVNYPIDVGHTLYTDRLLHLTGINNDVRPLRRNVKVEYKRRALKVGEGPSMMRAQTPPPSPEPPVWSNFYEMSLETQSIVLLDEWPKNILKTLQKIHRFLLFLTEDLVNERFERHHHKVSQLFKSMCNCIKLVYKDKALKAGDARLLVEWSHYIFNSLRDFFLETDVFCRKVLEVIELVVICVDYLKADPNKLDVREPKLDLSVFYDFLPVDANVKIGDRLLSSASLNLNNKGRAHKVIKKLSKNDFFSTDYHNLLKECPVTFGRSSSPEFKIRF